MKKTIFVALVLLLAASCRKDICITCTDSNGAAIGERCFATDIAKNNWLKRTRGMSGEEACKK
jgi:hypothetical protein